MGGLVNGLAEERVQRFNAQDKITVLEKQFEEEKATSNECENTQK